MNKCLVFDIETSPIVGYTWGLYQQDVIKTIRDSHFLSFSYKWLGEGKAKCLALPDFKTYQKNPYDDYELVKKLHELMEEADIILAHNGDQFDIKKANSRFLYHHLTPPSPYKTFDTLKVMKKHFKNASNKLDAIGEYLDVGRKVSTGGFELWEGCMNGDPKSWAKMKKYNKQDVELLERVFNELKPWIFQKEAIWQGRPNCKNCGGRLVSRGTRIQAGGKRYQRFQCKQCGLWDTGKRVIIKEV